MILELWTSRWVSLSSVAQRGHGSRWVRLGEFPCRVAWRMDRCCWLRRCRVFVERFRRGSWCGGMGRWRGCIWGAIGRWQGPAAAAGGSGGWSRWWKMIGWSSWCSWWKVNRSIGFGERWLLFESSVCLLVLSLLMDDEVLHREKE